MEGKKVSGKGGEISKGIFNLMLSQKNQITVLNNFSVIYLGSQKKLGSIFEIEQK